MYEKVGHMWTFVCAITTCHLYAYLFCSFDADHVDTVVHEIGEFGLGVGAEAAVEHNPVCVVQAEVVVPAAAFGEE